MRIDKNYRITLPKEAFKDYFADEFVNVTIKKEGIWHSFPVRIPSKCPSRRYLQVRRKIPKETIMALNLHPSDNVEFCNLKRIKPEYTNSFKGDLFDLVSLRFDNIMISTFKKEGEEWVYFWKSSKAGGITHPIELKRYIPVNRKTGEFFGLMQAESRKFGYKFDFTNIRISEHVLFVQVAEQFGIPRSAWSFEIHYNPKLTKIEALEAKNKFANELGLDNQKGYVTKNYTITSIAYTIDISSTILNSVMNKVLKILRERALSYVNQRKNFKEFCKGFILKDLLGDGTITFPSHQGMQVVISEQDNESQKYIMKMFAIFNINTNSILNRIYISTDFESALWFLRNGAFVGHVGNRLKLQSYVKRNFYFTNLEKKLKSINEAIDSRTFANASGLNLPAAKRFLERTYRRGFIKKRKYKNVNIYCLSERGKEFLKIMSSL